MDRSRLFRQLVLGCVCLATGLGFTAAGVRAAPSEIVRWDWYFRESLAAIRDWEALLARIEKLPASEQPAPVFPVPRDGRPVTWPNPIPLTLLPPEDRDTQLQLRSLDGQLQSRRLRGAVAEPWKPLPADQETVGYVHPGGGGKDQWYHRYDRRFDRLLKFRARPAALAVSLAATHDLTRGANTVTVDVRNASDGPLSLSVSWDLQRPSGSSSLAKDSCTLAAGESRAFKLPLVLKEPGGALAVLRIAAGSDACCVPLLQHVEDLPAILKGIEKILAETPDPTSAMELTALRSATEPAAAGGDAWRSLFERASAVRDDLLLRRLPFDTLLFLKRKPFISEQPFMDAHHLFNRPGGGLYRLTPVRPDGRVTAVIDTLGEGVYRDVCLHWNADRLLFAFGNGSDKWTGDPSYHLFELSLAGTGLRRLTSGPKNDCEPFYLPDGRIGFTSDRSEHYVMCGGDRHSPTLFVAEADGSGVRQLSFNVFNDFNPTLLPDGRILYSRWEYNERSVTALHKPFTMNPDGTMVAPYYGNASIRPNVGMFPRPVPGSSKVMALFTAHHGQTHGTVGVIDVRRGVDGPEALDILTPEVPLTGERAEDSRYGWFSDPQPLSETTFLCSYTPTVLPWLERSWALYVADRHGNLGLVYRDAEISCAEPVPLVARPAPHVRPSASPGTDTTEASATVAVADVYRGLPGVERGTAKFLRILEDLPRKSVPRGGVVLTSGTQIFTIKRILGTVPVEPDGSAFFTVPANRNVYFELLNADQREIQRMRSVVCLKPGENRTCIGCHESRLTAPPNQNVRALRRVPSQPEPPPWGTQIISFLRDIQPLLNDRCVSCHTFDRAANSVILTDDLTDQFTVGYEELLPYLSVANANRWDHPEDVYARAPFTYGSQVSRLMTLFDKDHHGVALSPAERLRLINWIDANGVYYDRYESDAYGSTRNLFRGAIRQTLQEVHARRCASCHGGGDGRQDTWVLSLNRHDVKLSRMLAAPLARAAGGWQRCSAPVFADTADADYQKLLTALDKVRQGLAERPREDLLSLRGSDAERQSVQLPPPPPPTPVIPDENRPSDNWVFLSDLPWQTARAGWTRNGDNAPRRDRDVLDQGLRLNRRPYRKGLGTHAPSEIVYDLDGKYERFHAVVGSAEDRGTVVFRVVGDEQVLFESGVMQSLREAKDVDVNVQGVKRLRLIVTDAGDGMIADMANWGDARLRKAGRPDAK